MFGKGCKQLLAPSHYTLHSFTLFPCSEMLFVLNVKHPLQVLQAVLCDEEFDNRSVLIDSCRSRVALTTRRYQRNS